MDPPVRFELTAFALRGRCTAICAIEALADSEGFEPPVVLPTLVFGTSAINQTRPTIQNTELDNYPGAHHEHVVELGLAPVVAF